MCNTHFEGFRDVYHLNRDWYQRHPSDTSLDDFAVNDVENRDNDGRQTVTPAAASLQQRQQLLG